MALDRGGRSKNPRRFSRQDYDQYLPLVRRIAMRIGRKVPRCVSVEDLVSCGWVGLMEAFRRSDPDMPTNEFQAYASYRIRGAMLDHLRSLDPSSQQARVLSKRLAEAISRIHNRTGRAAEEDEIAAELDLTLDDYRDVLTRIQLAGMARLELLDIDSVDLDSPEDLPDEEAAQRELSDAVATAIERLPQRLQYLLALYYQEGCTLKEIGAILGVTESRVSQLHTETMHRLRADIGRV